MSNIYHINNEHIEHLNDLQLTKLLSKLLYLEAGNYNIAKSSVNCSLKITVADGGEDASIKWEDGPSSTNWLKCRYNLFQCKATDMPPGKCKDEIIYKGENDSILVKSMVEKVFIEKGCYILFYNKSVNEKQVQDRILKFREALKEAGKDYSETASIYIYDANKIAEWVNNYLAAIVDVLSFNNVHLPANLLTWDEWSKYNEHIKYNFETDENMESHISQLRKHFEDNEKSIARIIGLSGLGKTRMALEVFRKNKTVGSEFINNKVIYIDAAYSENEIIPLVADLRRYEISTILVIDNCRLELHKALVKEVKHESSALSLLTLDYNLEKITADYPIIELKQVSTEVIKKIIKQSYSQIPEEDINRISEFAQGFPQMAVLISEARLNGEDTIGTLNDSEIANKLLWGRDKPDDIKLEVIKACAIFENFGFYDSKSIEKDYIAKNICDERINKENFYRYAQYFIKKGILDTRGRYLAVTPLPLAIRLAAEWWRECSPENGRRIMLSEMPNNMVEFLCAQISKLHFVEEARDLTEDLCGGTGPFGQAEVLLTKRGGRIFRALAEVNPQAASAAVYDAFKNYSVKELKEISIERRELTHALENLCFWEDTFDNSSRVLLMLAAAENESWANNATGIISQLMHVFLSGTQAELCKRLKVIREALINNEQSYKIVAIKLLGAAIETQGFSRMTGAEKQGIRAIQEEWKPKFWKEVFDYWEEALSMLTVIAENEDEFGRMARDEIVNHVRGLVQYGRMEALDKCLKTLGTNLNYGWIDINKKINESIIYDGPKIPQAGKEKLKDWLQLFTPSNFIDEFKLIVSLPNWDDEKNEQGDYIDVAEIKCRKFAKECIKKVEQLYGNLPVVYTGEQRQGFVFGIELGLQCKCPKDFIEKSMVCLKGIDNANVIVLAGFLRALREKNNPIEGETLDYILNDKLLNKFLVYITSMIMPDHRDIERIILLLNDRNFKISTFRSLAYGNALAKVKPEYIKKLCTALYNSNTEGKLIALDIINRSKEKISELKDVLASIILDIDVINNLNKFTQMDEYCWEENLKLLLKSEDGEVYACNLYKITMDNLLSYKFDLDRDKQHEKAVSILLKNFPKKIWNLIVENLMKASKEELWKFEDLLSAKWIYINGENSLIEIIDENDVIEKVNEYGERLALIISKIIKKYDSSNGELRFNPILRYIIENFGEDNIKILHSISFMMGPSTWWGSLIPSYEDKIKVLSEYANYHKVNIKNWALDNIKSSNKAISIEKVKDEEESKGIY
ncbi:hypothetical protein LL033_20660 [Clostridium estertheticum]|uniref:hypothetical protein n=1 Tax=Clostridium estertheticum TaxID=238834 RepID=UPI001C0C37D8|nr:hypothetical protein [Clostridium estertheticum]MBU3213977.1 hypothetical protein [Clostridium estertheticum]WAG54992.1 hypothetical protein LL033_20660 [Clostridium estertheticum]